MSVRAAIQALEDKLSMLRRSLALSKTYRSKVNTVTQEYLQECIDEVEQGISVLLEYQKDIENDEEQ